ncbi:MAG: hypothetical protein ACYDBB_22980 [Armatimonadota bacterium]
MKRWLMIVLVVLALWSAVCRAQTPPSTALIPLRYKLLDLQHQPLAVATPQGFFVLRKGVLAKFNIDTLAPEGQVNLFGALPAAPAADTEWSTRLHYASECVLRIVPASMQADGDDLLLLIGDQYIRVDANSLQVLVNRSLAPADQRLRRADDWARAAAPVLQVNGKAVYTTNPVGPGRSLSQLRAVNRENGDPLALKELPAAMTRRLSFLPMKGGLGLTSLPALLQNPSTVLAATPDALYVLRMGVLAKLDPATLEPRKLVELFGLPAGVAEIAKATEEQKRAVNIDHAIRYLPAAILAGDKELSIVVGDRFFRVDADGNLLASATLATVDDAAVGKRIEELIALGAPALSRIGNDLVITRGKQVSLLNGKTLTVREGKLADAQLRALPYPMTRPVVARPPVMPPAPREDQEVKLYGLLQQQTGVGGEYWSLLDEYGREFVLTGNKVPELVARPKMQQSQVFLTGLFKKQRPDVPTLGLGSIEVKEMLNFDPFPVRGILVKHAGPAETYWTVKSDYGQLEFVLTGAKVKALVEIADVELRRVTVYGKYRRSVEGMPAYGRGCLEVESYTIKPSPAEEIAAQEAGLPADFMASENGVYAIRNGIMTRLDPATLEQKAQRELFPPLPPLPAGGLSNDAALAKFTEDRARRQLPAQLLPQADGVLVFLGNQYFRVDAVTLAERAHATPLGNTEWLTRVFTLGNDRCCLLQGDKLVLLKSTTGAVLNPKQELPAEMQGYLFPETAAMSKPPGGK